ncbi:MULTISPECIES: TetR family transcriptional regulator [Pseudomonas putida group]|uniref:TetR family transcriptional regulator n=1 Tax=Pseudomonas putida group TaxID=136845 RepID=UPI0018AB5BF5|nr:MULTISPECIES: TetR family transcriptional regulator [Pseudomonas putida group]MBF8679929.1 TetR family transcriptional regulator [Pseudomonas fulva]MBF8717666.1 TetR family transcriptional regulator [Pseudomonas fulva]MBF8764132.1 TetR family transcriptional regulator [Pseudomonas putida]MBF8784732.1 TetR family transcriptional regulator [Pseudomonas fulva]
MPTRKTGIRAQQADRTRDNILKAAVQVFSREGYAGGRVEQISTLAKSNDRMIYYYFGNKEKLFISVLEHIYASFNQAEAGLQLDLDDPEQAVRTLVAFIWDYYVQHPEFVTLLATENLHQGEHARKSQNLKALSGEAVGVLRPIIDAGQAKGLFRDDIDITHAYLMIASLCYFYNSNRHTLSSFLAVDLADPKAKADWLAFISDLVLRGLRL